MTKREGGSWWIGREEGQQVGSGCGGRRVGGMILRKGLVQIRRERSQLLNRIEKQLANEVEMELKRKGHLRRADGQAGWRDSADSTDIV